VRHARSSSSFPDKATHSQYAACMPTLCFSTGCLLVQHNTRDYVVGGCSMRCGRAVRKSATAACMAAASLELSVTRTFHACSLRASVLGYEPMPTCTGVQHGSRSVMLVLSGCTLSLYKGEDQAPHQLTLMLLTVSILRQTSIRHRHNARFQNAVEMLQGGMHRSELVVYS
jgi:hypothetical protein